MNLKNGATYEVAKINGVDIICANEKGMKLIPVRPICEILGIDHRKQIERIKKDEIFGQFVYHTVHISEGNLKNKEVFCIPLRYVFGWILSIQSARISPEARPDFLKYKIKCYDALYERFVEKADFYSEKDYKKLDLNQELEVRKEAVNEIKDKIRRIEGVTFADWQADRMQLSLDFEPPESDVVSSEKGDDQ